MADKFTYEQLHTPMDAPLQYQREQQKHEHEKMMEELPRVLKAMTEPKHPVVQALEQASEKLLRAQSLCVLSQKASHRGEV